MLHVLTLCRSCGSAGEFGKFRTHVSLLLFWHACRMHFHIYLSFLCRLLYCFTIFLLYSLCFSSTSSEDLVFIISFFFIRIFIIETYPLVTSALEQLLSLLAFFRCFINLTISGLSNHDLFSMNIYACYMLYLHKHTSEWRWIITSILIITNTVTRLL